MKKNLVIVQIIILEKFNVIIIGIISAISTSKIKKIIAIKKKCNEKGRREEDFGSNPHSKGELFSRSTIDFLDNKDAIKIIRRAIINKIVLIINIIRIINTIKL
jgi:hypothetical protein